MDMTALLVQLISGAIGGTAAGAMLKNLSLGPIGNAIAGIVGGGIGGQILGAMMGGGGAAATGSVLGSVAGGGIGGIVVMVIVGVIKNLMGKPSN